MERELRELTGLRAKHQATFVIAESLTSTVGLPEQAKSCVPARSAASAGFHTPHGARRQSGSPHNPANVPGKALVFKG
jgi:hypothetical protein